MARDSKYCAVCGGPISPGFGYGSDDNPPRKWLEHAVILTTGHETDNGVEHDIYYSHYGDWYNVHIRPDPSNESDRRVLQYENTTNGYNSWGIVDMDLHVEVFTLLPDSFFESDSEDEGHGEEDTDEDYASEGSDFMTNKGRLYIVVHRQCIRLAERFIQSRGINHDTFDMGPDETISSIKHLWQVLCGRVEGTLNDTTHRSLEEPHDYYGGGGSRNMDWERDDSDYGPLMEVDPIFIPNLTEVILQNLHPRPESSEPSEAGKDQEYWFNLIIENKYFPWLWDIDCSMLRQKRDSGNWDWELLASNLSKVEIYQPKDTTLVLPLGLKNRRRIWRVLQEARVGDVKNLYSRA